MKENNNIFDQNENKKLTRLSTITIILFTIVVFALIIFGLYKINVIEIPSFIKNLFAGSNVSENNYVEKTYDDQNFIEFIKKDNENVIEDSVIYISIESLDFTELIASAPFITEYSLTQNINYYDSSRRQKISKNKIWVKDDKYLVEIYNENDVMIKYILCDGEYVYIKDYTAYDEPHTKTYPVSEEFTLENQVGLIDIRTLNTSEMDIKLSRDEKTNQYIITYQYSDIPELIEVIKVSFEYGLIIDAETFYNDELIYRMNTNGKVSVGNVSDDIFILK